MNEPIRDEELSAMIAGAPRPQLDEAALREIHRRIDRELVRITVVNFSRWCGAAAAAILLVCSGLLMIEVNTNGGEPSAPLGESLAAFQPQETAETPVEIEIATWIAADLRGSDGD